MCSRLYSLLLLLPIGNAENELDIRLVGGSYMWQGRVELFSSGVLSTVTFDHNQRGFLAAKVICRQLGYGMYCKVVDQTVNALTDKSYFPDFRDTFSLLCKVWRRHWSNSLQDSIV